MTYPLPLFTQPLLLSSLLFVPNVLNAANYYDGINVYLDDVRTIDFEQGAFTDVRLQAIDGNFVLKHINLQPQDVTGNSKPPVVYSMQSQKLWIPDIEDRSSDQVQTWDVVLVQQEGVLPPTFTLTYAERNQEKQSFLGDTLNSAEVNNQLEAIRVENNIVGMSVAVTKGKDIVWSRGFGLSDDEEVVAATANTPFRLGSVSKTFLSVATMTSVEAGVMSLDQPINHFLSYPVYHPDAPDAEITIRQLMNHTSGITDTLVYNCSYYSPDHPDVFNAFYHKLIPPQACSDNYSTETATFLEQYLSSGENGINSAEHFNATPGTTFQYSNIGAGLAGEIIALANNQSINQLLKRVIFEPLNMVNTGYVAEDFANHAVRSKNYDYTDGILTRIPDYTYPTFADGALYSSANDLARYLTFLSNDGRLMKQQVMSAESVQEMFHPSDTNNGGEHYGSFWQISGPVVSHGGGDPGVETVIWLNRESNIGIVVLLNTSSIAQEGNVVDKIASYLAGVTH